MRVNTAVKTAPVYTHGGAVGKSAPNAELELRRSVMTCMLWEDQFYEDGKAIADRIVENAKKVSFDALATIAIEAREDMKLRHVPLLLATVAAANHNGRKVGDLIERVIQRPDEISELLAIYWKAGKRPLSKQLKVGLARAFRKFDEYALAKYNQDNAIKLRDVLFLCHAKPVDSKQEKLWKKLVEGKLKTPDTWEVALSAGADKKDTFVRMMADKKLGALAFVRNLRNMKEAGVDKKLVMAYADDVKLDRVLPFRFVAAAKMVPGWEDVCDKMLLRASANLEKLEGKTVVVVDVSGSMGYGKVSAKSDMTRLQAAGALAAILRESCEDVTIYATAGSDYARTHKTAEVPNRRGMGLVELFERRFPELGGGGIFLTQCLEFVKDKEKTADRLIVLTDEQDCDRKLTPEKADAFAKKNYILNVASYKNGVGYKKFVHIDGWSESVVDYIRMLEKL